MDELMMNLFSIITEQIRNKQELFEEEGKIMQVLVDSGYRLHEADAALTLMQVLAKETSDRRFALNKAAHVSGMRTMSIRERERFTLEAFSFVSRLALFGIISEGQREDILERALTVYPERVELDQIKTLVAVALFNSGGGRDGVHLSPSDRVKYTAWN